MSTPKSTLIEEEGFISPMSTSIIYVAPVGYNASITSISLTDTSAFDITLNIYRDYSAINTDIYNFSLSAGDFLADNTNYYLQPGDFISITSSGPLTRFRLSGRRIPITVL